jgi:NADPH2:quinone reductase
VLEAGGSVDGMGGLYRRGFDARRIAPAKILRTMRAAILRAHGATPEPGDWDEPRPADGQAAVDVLVAGLNPVDLSIASGRFYQGPPPIPSIVGSEGIVRLPDGRRAYVDATVKPFGTMAERTLIDPAGAIPLPDGVDDGVAVALGIAGLAAWLGLEWRAGLQAGEHVLVLGASGTVGQVAVQAARLLGAGRVVAAARSAEALERARGLGADAAVQLGDDVDLAEAFREATEGRLDVVVDPLWGPPALAAMQAASRYARVVQLGQSAAAELSLPSAVVRGRPLSLLGHTNFAAPAEVKRAAYTRMAEAAAAGELTVEVERVPLERVGEAWERQASSPRRKLVIVP